MSGPPSCLLNVTCTSSTLAPSAIADIPGYAENNCWMVLLQIDKEVYGENRESLMQRLKGNGIQTRPVWALNHLQKPYRNCQTYYIENAKKMVEISLCIPSSTNLSSKSFIEIRIFDIILSFSLIILMIPVYITVVFAILIFQGRPTIFKQDRLGKNHAPFKIIKFCEIIF